MSTHPQPPSTKPEAFPPPEGTPQGAASAPQPPVGAGTGTPGQGDAGALDGSLTAARAWFAQNGLTRPRRGKMIAGVCAALARRYGVNVLVMRLLFVVAAIIGAPVLLYIVLWVLIPREP
jgi:phage shock protein PspC (stress-responsive transcriptional regulator)